MNVAIVGYTGCGKSTLFELLTGVKPDPAVAHQGQKAMAVLPDRRLDALAAMYKPKKVTPAALELHDTPGLHRDAHKDNARRLSLLREAEGLVLVVAAFDRRDPHPELRAFEDDLLLADLEIVTNRLTRLREAVKKPRPEREALLQEAALVEPIAAALADGKSLAFASARARVDRLQTGAESTVRSDRLPPGADRDEGPRTRGRYELSDAQERAVRSFGLLALKPRVVVVNLPDEAAAAGRLDPASLAAGLRVEAAPLRLELDLAALPPDEQQAFLQEYGLREPSRGRLLDAILDTCGWIRFYTSGDREARAWLLRRGASALEAAESIHTDFARGFIRAEVIPIDELLRAGSEHEAKARGHHRLEGKDYIVKDGDWVIIRFNV